MTPASLYVPYPQKGYRLLISWWTGDDRGHVIVARSQEAAENIARRVIAKEHGNLRIDSYREVELVAPSERLCVEVDAPERVDAVQHFLWKVTGRVAEAIKAGTAVHGFRRCTRFKVAKGDGKPDAWSRKRHSGCARCGGMEVISELTPEELYDRFFVAWCMDPFVTLCADARATAKLRREAEEDANDEAQELKTVKDATAVAVFFARHSERRPG